MEKRRGPNSVNWDALKAEWLQGDESLNKFRIRYRLAPAHFYQKVDEYGWEKSREIINKKAIAKIENTQAGLLAREWKQEIDLLNAAKSEVVRALNKSRDSGKTLNYQELSNLFTALDKAVKTKSFINGGPTERIESRNIHVAIVDWMAKDFSEGQEGNK